jgi:hypothetical protein
VLGIGFGVGMVKGTAVGKPLVVLCLMSSQP